MIFLIQSEYLGQFMHTFCLATPSVSVLIASKLLVCFSIMATAFFLHQCSEYLLYLVLVYRFHSFIKRQTLLTHNPLD